MRHLYSLLFYLLLPIIALRMLLRSRQAPAYRQRMGERLGVFALPAAWRDDRPWLWVHAVSVGETLAAAPVIEELLARYPGHKLLVTTTTPTGSEQVRKLFGDRVFHAYAPWDLPGAMRRFVGKLRPQLLLIMETELWPNMLHYTHHADCRILLANARLSARSARGYARFSNLTRQMLQHLDSVACQAQEDGERLLALGLPAERLHITGSIKFDLELDDALRSQASTLREAWQADTRPVLVAASTHPGEDEQILEAFCMLRGQRNDSLLVLVPRHPERFDGVYEQCAAAGWNTLRRSAGVTPDATVDIVLGDTMGELVLLLALGRIAVIGGSLIPHGGHNVLEAAAWGVPVVTGPHMFNFAQISDLMEAEGAMLRLNDPATLGTALVELVDDEARLARMGEAGLAVVAANRGARSRLLELVDAELQPGD